MAIGETLLVCKSALNNYIKRGQILYKTGGAGEVVTIGEEAPSRDNSNDNSRENSRVNTRKNSKESSRQFPGKIQDRIQERI